MRLQTDERDGKQMGVGQPANGARRRMEIGQRGTETANEMRWQMGQDGEWRGVRDGADKQVRGACGGGKPWGCIP